VVGIVCGNASFSLQEQERNAMVIFNGTCEGQIAFFAKIPLPLALLFFRLEIRR